MDQIEYSSINEIVAFLRQQCLLRLSSPEERKSSYWEATNLHYVAHWLEEQKKDHNS